MKDTLIAQTSISVDASAAQVWKALTTPRLVKKYLMGTDVATDWKEGSPITYSGEYEGDDAYSLTGDYKITGENVTVTTLITKGGVEVHRYETKGKVIDTEGIALSITGKVKDWLNNH